MKKRALLLLAIVVIIALFCGTASAEKVFRWATSQNYQTVYPLGGNNEIMDYCGAKLYTYMPSPDGLRPILVPDLADGLPETTDGGTTWIIKINKNAKWSNGEPINADTFMYSWSKALDPMLIKMNPASTGLARNILDIENAYAYYTQGDKKEVKWEDVGFKKIDDYTVQIKATGRYTQTHVMQHFNMRYTGVVYQPLFDAGMDETGTTTNYGTEVEYYMSAGPMKLVSFTKGAEIIMEKNPYYVHADLVDMDKIICRIVQDENTQIQLYQSGELDYLSLGTNGVELYGEDPDTQSYVSNQMREIQINFENPAHPWLGNLNFRKALYFAIDRASLAKLTNSVPSAYFLTPSYTTMADGTPFRSLPIAQSYLPANDGYDPVLAKEYFDKALKELNVDKVELHMMYNEAIAQQRLASESIQDSMTRLFGADRFSMTLSAMNGTQMSRTMRVAQQGPTDTWDLGWLSWNMTAALYSANRKFEPYMGTDARRFTNYPNKLVDELVRLSLTEEYRLDDKKLTEITAQMEKEFLDDVDVIPVFQPLVYYRFSDKVVPPYKEYMPLVLWAFPFMRSAQ